MAATHFGTSVAVPDACRAPTDVRIHVLHGLFRPPVRRAGEAIGSIDLRVAVGQGPAGGPASYTCVVNPKRLLDKAVRQPNGLRFDELVGLVEAFGFRLKRIRGSHHMYTRPGLMQQVNLQPDGPKAKPYQVRAFVKLVETAKLSLEGDS